MSIPKPPEHMMRQMLHTSAKKVTYIALVASVASSVAMMYFYTIPKQRKYNEYFKNLDNEKRFKEICSYPKKFLVSCPQVVMEKRLNALKEENAGKSEEEIQEVIKAFMERNEANQAYFKELVDSLEMPPPSKFEEKIPGEVPLLKWFI